MNFFLNIRGPIKHLPTDFVIISQNGKEIPCHKFVLAIASPVFDAMFDMKDSKEVLEGRIEIKDTSNKALETMVQFMYNQDELIVDKNLFEDLLVLSNKYSLKVLAENIIPKFIANVDVNNCIQAYVFGFLHEYEKIKEVAFNIIIFIWDRLQKDESSQLTQLSKYYPREYENLCNKIKNFSSYSPDVLHINNCIEAFTFAFQQEYENLKRSAFNFIRSNWKWIQTEESRLNKLSSIVGPNGYLNLLVKFGKPLLFPPGERPMKISPELADVIGLVRATRTECVKLLWAYIKEKNLQDPENKQYFIPDSKMAKVFGANKMKGFSMARHIGRHLSHISDFDLL